jgi:hypothetical protein
MEIASLWFDIDAPAVAPPIPKSVDWQSLMRLDGDELETHYCHVLESLGKQKGLLAVVFCKAQNKIQDPTKRRRLRARRAAASWRESPTLTDEI